jgi:uncharacterized alkaline shock family protein YloU
MTDTSTSSSSGAPRSSGSDAPGGGLQHQGGSQLLTEHGTTSIADSVVAKIAGVAAKEMSGVHAMGGTAGRAIGAIRDRIGGTSAGQGVKVEVGQRQAAIDIDIIVDYGVSIVDLSQAVRDNAIRQVERMTGLEVTEVNISVNDVYLGDEGEDDSEPRVQ